MIIPNIQRRLNNLKYLRIIRNLQQLRAIPEKLEKSRKNPERIPKESRKNPKWKSTWQLRDSSSSVWRAASEDVLGLRKTLRTLRSSRAVSINLKANNGRFKPHTLKLSEWRVRILFRRYSRWNTKESESEYFARESLLWLSKSLPDSERCRLISLSHTWSVKDLKTVLINLKQIAINLG